LESVALMNYESISIAGTQNLGYIPLACLFLFVHCEHVKNQIYGPTFVRVLRITTYFFTYFSLAKMELLIAIRRAIRLWQFTEVSLAMVITFNIITAFRS